MNDIRETFLEKQINIHSDIIDEMESSRISGKQNVDLKNMKILYKKYIQEYKELLLNQKVG